MRPALIERKYQELSILKNYAGVVTQKVGDATAKMIEGIVAAGLDAEQIENLQQRVLGLQMREHDVQQRLAQLSSQAASLGFRLPLREEKITLEDHKEPKTLQPGKLYRPYRRIARWTTDHTRQEIDWALVAALAWLGPLALLALAAPKTVHEKRRHEREVTDYEAIDTAKDLLSARREALIRDGMQAFVLQQTPAGFATADGLPLEMLMARCRFDEHFRRHCAIMLPVYEESLRGERLVAKYSIFKRPLPGLLPTMLPRLSLEESLSYRTAWQETRLGELISTINLAPGEERKVTITKGFKRETAVTRSSTSIFDITRSESTDLATEMEDLARQEKEELSNLNFSTKASGGFAGFTAEATASGGTTSSLKDVSQAVSKVAKKAAQSVSEQSRQEVTSTSTARAKVTESDETVATIRNINQGRSLNLSFYRLYNKYEGGLYLEGLRFDVIPGVAVIEGSGVHQSRSYSLEQLPEMMQEFGAAALPFDFKDRQQQHAYTERVLDSIETLLRQEYAKDPEPEARGADGAGAPTTSVGLLTLPPRRAGPDRKAAPPEERASGCLEELHRMLRVASVDSDEPKEPAPLMVASSGLYLNSVVGALASTEPYSEQMREQELRLRSAEVFFRESEGFYKRALALRLAHLRRADGGNVVIGIMPDDEHNRLALKLRLPLAADGDWHLLVDGEDMGKPAEIVGRSVTFAWDEAQEWLDADDLAARIALLDHHYGHTIGYPA